MGCDRNSVIQKGDVTPGNNFHITIMPDSREETDQFYNGLLGGGGKADFPLQEMFWGSYYGYLTDQFGVQWMFDYSAPQPKQVLTATAKELRAIADDLDAAAAVEPETKQTKTDS